MIIQSHGQLSIRSIGIVESNLVESNYEKSVIEDHMKVVNEFQKVEPYGRLAVYDGPAGTGKTNLIEHFISSLSSSRFSIIQVPPALIGSLANPEFIPTLLSEVRNKKSIVFVLEDADDALVKRSDDKKSGPLSALLNFCDGTIGKKLDTRIVATTNLSFGEKSEFSHKIDPAADRPGRIFKRIHVGHLNKYDASKVISRISRQDIYVEESMTLAECYQKAYSILQK